MFGFGNRRKGRPVGGGYYGPQDSPSLAHRKDRLLRLVVVLSFVVLIATITELPGLGTTTTMHDIDSETIASETIKAEYAFKSMDLEATRENRDKEATGIALTYIIDVDRVNTQIENLRTRIISLEGRRNDVEESVRNALLASTSLDLDGDVTAGAVAEFARKMKEVPLYTDWPDASILAAWLMPDMETVPRREFESETHTREIAGDNDAVREFEEYRNVKDLVDPESVAFEFANTEPLTKVALEGLEYLLIRGVIQPSSIAAAEGDEPARVQIIRSKLVGDLSLTQEVELANIPGPDEARAMLATHIATIVRGMESESVGGSVDWELVRNAATEMAKSSVTDTLFYEQLITEANKEQARQSVKPVMKSFDVNEIIQEDGRHWTAQSRSDVKTYWSEQATGRPSTRSIVSPILANMIFAALLLLALLRAMPVLTQSRDESHKSIILMLLIICSTLVLGRIVYNFETSGLVVPVTAGAILLTILTNARVATVASTVSVILLSIQYGRNWEVLIVAGAMSFMGIASLYAVRRRGDMAGAAIKATLVGLAAVLAITLAKGTLAEWETVYGMAKIAINGAICLFIVPGLLSPLERLFRITTDIQLLEYSDLNNDLLRRVAIEIPATSAHSLMLGQMAEAAADAIGANGLLARVCAYYHDIGKLRRPEYFSENQTGYNVHDELSPRLSARAISSHVSEGADMAREHHLPQPIIDGILEHHGTLTISFFFQEALNQAKHGDVREEDFRYPGPKPRSPETAILMICDAVESGVRTIKNPNEERVREFVDKIIQYRSEDRQFHECDITLKKLDTIGEVLTKYVMTTLHTRVAYPEREVEETAANVIPLSGRRE